MFKIRLQLKGKGMLVTERMTEEAADAALAGEIADKLGSGKAIVLPGVCVRGDEVVGAQKISATARAVRLA